MLAVGVFCLTGLLLPGSISLDVRLLIAFDLAATVYISAIFLMMLGASIDGMRQRAQMEDERKWTVLLLGSVSAVAVLVALAFVLHDAKMLPGSSGGGHVALAAATIVLSWVFMNVLFALHYAHDYYGDADSDGGPVGGLRFPGEEQPDYWDFVYFSFVIGMTFQVSDVQVESRLMRRLVVAHGALAFFFNVGVLALAINITAGLL